MRDLRAALGLVLLGLLVAIVDIRIDGLDLVADPLGFAAAAVGVLAARRHGLPAGWATVAAAGFVVAAVLAVPDMLTKPERFTGIRVEPRDAAGIAKALLHTAQDVGLGATMMGVSIAAAARGAASLARHARWLAWAFAAFLAIGLLLDAAWLAGADEDVLVAGFVLLVPNLVAFVLALVLLWRARDLAPPRDGLPLDAPPDAV